MLGDVVVVVSTQEEWECKGVTIFIYPELTETSDREYNYPSSRFNRTPSQKSRAPTISQRRRIGILANIDIYPSI